MREAPRQTAPFSQKPPFRPKHPPKTAPFRPKSAGRSAPNRPFFPNTAVSPQASPNTHKQHTQHHTHTHTPHPYSVCVGCFFSCTHTQNQTNQHTQTRTHTHKRNTHTTHTTHTRHTHTTHTTHTHTTQHTTHTRHGVVPQGGAEPPSGTTCGGAAVEALRAGGVVPGGGAFRQALKGNIDLKCLTQRT